MRILVLPTMLCREQCRPWHFISDPQTAQNGKNVYRNARDLYAIRLKARGPEDATMRTELEESAVAIFLLHARVRVELL